MSSEWAYCSKDRETMKRRWILAVFFSQFLQHSYINELIPTLLGDIETDLSDTFHFLYREIEGYLEEKKRDFSKLVHKKRINYSIEREKVSA